MKTARRLFWQFLGLIVGLGEVVDQIDDGIMVSIVFAGGEIDVIDITLAGAGTCRE